MTVNFRLTILVLATYFGATAHAHAQTFLATEYDISLNQAPQSAVDVLSTPEARALVGAVAVSFGAPPNLTGALLAAVPSPTRKGEEYRWRFYLPSGYVFCNGGVQINSISGGTTFNSVSDQQGIGYYAHVPRANFGGGNNWAKAKWSVLGVRADQRDYYLSRGVCRTYDAIDWRCKGRECWGRR
jgi:hypothetical protein